LIEKLHKIEFLQGLSNIIRIYPLLKIERLSYYTKLTLYKALIRSLMIYACPAWQFVVDSHLLELQRL